MFSAVKTEKDRKKTAPYARSSQDCVDLYGGS